MKKLHLITLTAICMVSGMNLIKGESFLGSKDTLNIANTSSFPVKVDVKFAYKKSDKGINKTRHQVKSVTLAKGGSNNQTTNSIKYATQDSSVVLINVTNTDNGKSSSIQKDKQKAYHPVAITISNNDDTPKITITK